MRVTLLNLIFTTIILIFIVVIQVKLTFTIQELLPDRFLMNDQCIFHILFTFKSMTNLELYFIMMDENNILCFVIIKDYFRQTEASAGIGSKLLL